MSMTRDEIIEAYESAVFSSGLSAAAGNEEAARDYELLKAGLDALRAPIREQVERMRGEWIGDNDEFGLTCDVREDEVNKWLKDVAPPILKQIFLQQFEIKPSVCGSNNKEDIA